MPFAKQTRVSPKYHILDGDPDPQWEEALSTGPIVTYLRMTAFRTVPLPSLANVPAQRTKNS